ncbi:hypothetical protein [Cystobacter fuscus]|uniref:hypothetical protein n=1 Tax=Cystobacter fuscus TaxID=43 RepID=UPI002B2A2356|nr:hypothetical protein F0U63_13395 [Cystobacter fuscus]
MVGDPEKFARFALVKVHWLDIISPLEYPSLRKFGTTGYREADGPDGLFSIYVVLLDGQPGPGAEQNARIFALVEEMEDRLPTAGEHFVITAGARPVAHCIGINPGLDSPARQVK